MLPDFRVRQRDYLLEITRALTQELDLDVVLEKILRFSIELLAGHAGLIVLRGESGGWAIRVAEGISPTFLQQLNPLLNEIPDTEDPQVFEIRELNRILHELTFADSLGLLSGVGLPMITQHSVKGVIFIFRSYMGQFSANDHILLSSFANQAAIAVQNAQLYTKVNLNKQHTDALLDSSADGILILSSNLIIEKSNISYSKMASLKIDEIQGKSHDEIVHLDNVTHTTTLDKAIAGGWPLDSNVHLYVEGDLKRPNLPSLPVGITYAPLISTEGKLLNIIANFRDISHFRKAEELKSEFISVISHELKTPVALIKGYVCTLRRDDVKWERKIIDESLQVIEEETDRLSGLIENLLDATRLQAGGIKLKKADIQLPVMASRLAERFKTQTDRHTISVKFPKDFPVVLADEVRIEQVITNLLNNAIKYTDSGEITISGRVQPEIVIVCIKDQGQGIAPHDIPFVFDRFYRSPDSAREKKGAGLGLYLARAIIEAHSGKIWVDSKNGVGTQVCFSLPR